MTLKLEWQRQPKQVEFIRATGLSHPFDGGNPKPPIAEVILYGGSAGGGKSDALIVFALIAASSFPGCQTVIFRRLYPELEGPKGLIMRSQELYNQDIGLGKTKLASWHGGNRRWTFFNGSVIQFAHCKTEADVHSYQSQQFDYMLFDESTQFTEFQLRYLSSRNRATVYGTTPLILMATNPGGVSHGYHLRMFIEPGPPGTPISVEVEPNQWQKHLFIPSRLSDNEVLEERDPGYRKRLENLPTDLRRALLEGDWNVFEGQYFRDFRTDIHTVEPFDIPNDWRRFGSFDWGFAAPAAFLWHAIEPSMGRVYTYREMYVTQMRAGEVAKAVLEHTAGEELEYIVISPDAFRETGLGSKASPGETVADEFDKIGLTVEPADNRRVLGWQRMREYLSIAPDENPWWQIFTTCNNLIRTMPQLIHDKNKVEDVSGDCEDHAPEAARYFLMSRPSPLEGATFLSGSREQYKKEGSLDEDDDYDDIVGGEHINFYGI
jgi:phage terminase large subunit